MEEIREFQLSELNVDQENFRLGTFPDQRSALQAMVRRQGHKLVELAKDIEAVGLSPGEPLWVAPDPDAMGRYVVMEGNRRVTALKVMDNPALAAGTDYETAFRKLGLAFAARPRRTVRATVFESVEAARPWVERRHTNEQSGVGIQWWDPFAQDRSAKAAGKSRNRSMVVLEHFNPGDPEPLAVKLKIDDRTTTVDRLLNTFVEKFGDGLSMEIPRKKPWKLRFGSDPETAEALLFQILEANRGLVVDKVKEVGQRETFLKLIIDRVLSTAEDNTDGPEADSLKSDGVTPRPKSGPWSPSVNDEPSVAPRLPPPGEPAKPDVPLPAGRRPKRLHSDRTTLADKSLTASATLHVDAMRLRQIYKECRDIEVEPFRNASGMLLRLFLELSSEAYLEKFVPLPGDLKSKGNWSAKGIRLHQKVKAVLHHLDPTQSDGTLRHAREGLSDDPIVPHSLDKIHHYMHDPNRVIIPKEVQQTWDRWHGYFRAIHDRLSGAD